MWVKGRVAAFWLFFSLAVSLQAAENYQSPLRFRHYSVREGLSQSSIKTMLQDRRGFIWFGTEDGLSRFDGYSFRTFKIDIDDPQSAAVSFMNHLFQDREGVIWIASRGSGLSRFDCTENKFVNYRHDPDDADSLPGDTVNHIAEDRDGGLWITTNNGLSRLDRATGLFVTYVGDRERPGALAPGSLGEMLVDRTGRLWITLANGQIDRYIADTDSFEHFRLPAGDPSVSEEEVDALMQLPEGEILLGTSSGRLLLLDPDSGSISPFPLPIPELVQQQLVGIQCFFLDADGNLFIGTDRAGVVIVDPARQTYRLETHNPAIPTSLAHDSVSQIILDHSGQLWFGTYRGASVYDPRINRFENFTNDPSNPRTLSGSAVFTLAEDHDGALWVGTDTGGLNRLDPLTGFFSHYMPDPHNPRAIPDRFVRTIVVDDDNHLWIGSTRHGLVEFDPRRGVLRRWRQGSRPGRDLSSDYIRALFRDSDGIIWAGTLSGLDRIDPATGSVTSYHSIADDPTTLASDLLTAIIEDREGYLWVATTRGLARMDSATGQCVRFYNDPQNTRSLNSDRVYSVFQDSQGTIWAGTNSGLCRINPRDYSISRITEKQGLRNNVINAILEDDDGRLWVSTNIGLSALDLQTGAITNYTYDDGLQDNEFNLGACLKDRSGKLLFGGIDGFNRFDPRAIGMSSFIPPVSFTTVTTPRERFETICGKLEMEQIELKPGARQITFEFVALDFRNPEKNRYRYRLAGFDPDWIESGDRRFATYTNLPPGEYRMLVQGSSSDGVWNEEGASLVVFVTPELWETLFFRLFAGVLLIIGVVGLIRWRRRKAEFRASELERQVAEKTRELEAKSQEQEAFNYSVSHDLRSPLWRIHNYCELLLDEYRDTLDPEGLQRLERVRDISVEMTDLINHLLALSRAGRREMTIAPANLSEIMREALAALSERETGRRIQITIEPELTAPCDASLMTIALTNLAENAVKYSIGREITRIEFGMERINGEGGYFLRDNGSGFEMEDAERIFEPFVRATIDHRIKGSGIGLATVRRVIQRHGGRVWAESTPGEGSIFRFTLGRPR